MYGKQAKVVKAGNIVDEGTVAKVLRGICFSGVGIVKNPANPPSVVLDATASTEETIVLDYDAKEKSNSNNVTSLNTEDVTNNVTDEQADLQYNDTVGVCVNYKKELHDTVIEDQDAKIIATNWCSKYDSNCPAAGNATSDDCLRVRVINETVRLVEAKMDAVEKKNKIEALTDNLILVLKK
jgi:co-chaperonin GroES (HSP10)